MCQESQKGFAKLAGLFVSKSPDTFYESPDDIWEAIGLVNLVHSSFDELLDALGLEKELSWWRKLLPYQGSLRSELLTAINLVNYNQDNSQVNGLVGLGSFAPSSGGLFSVVGGNYKIVRSALEQAIKIRDGNCSGRKSIQQVEKRVTTVLGTSNGFILYSDQEILGNFDIVVLAAPLQQSKINLLIQSHMDEAVVQPMPLAGLVDAHEKPTEEGHSLLAQKLPESAMRPFTQVVTTVVSNATLNADYLSLSETYLPRSVLMTASGKSSLYNITAITQVSSAGVFKMFSDSRLDDEALKNIFGQYHKTEYVKVWGGAHGGATPDYQGNGISVNFLLYDGADSGALYYPSAMEQSSLACIEMSAIGARAVAKLLARRLGLIESRADDVRDEL
jgi:prenylcysteine oxidase/farnesylcysteine lyase